MSVILKNFERKDVRWNSQESIGTSTFDPSDPIISTSVIVDAILKVPIVTGVGEVSEGVVGSDSISSPSRNRYTEIFNVCCTCWEVDTVDKIRNGVNVGLIDTID